MSDQHDLRAAKAAVRTWIKQFSDERLIEVYAFNQDGKMTYEDPCGCLLGVTKAVRLHTIVKRDLSYRGQCPEHRGVHGTGSHYDEAERLLDNGGDRAEKAYFELGFIGEKIFGAIPNLRQRRTSAILRAEIKLRSRTSPVLHPVEEFVAR